MKRPTQQPRRREKIELPLYSKWSLYLLTATLIGYYVAAFLSTRERDYFSGLGWLLFMLLLAIALGTAIVGFFKDRPRIFAVIAMLLSGGLLTFFIAAKLFG